MYDYANFTASANRPFGESNGPIGTPMSTISRMLPGKRNNNPFENEASFMNQFLNTPIRTRNQYKMDSIAGSSMVSPYI